MESRIELGLRKILGEQVEVPEPMSRVEKLLKQIAEQGLSGGGGTGTPGRGIQKIEKTSTQGLVDTYTITYTDATTSTFTITNGQDGEDGAPGQAGTPGENGLTPTIGENGNWFLGETDTGKPSRGEQGNPGASGQGVSAGGTAGQILSKVDGTDYNTEWIDPPDIIELQQEVNTLSSDVSGLKIIINGLTTDTQMWSYLTQLADNNLFSRIYNFGDQFVETWTDTAASKPYEYPFQLNHIGNVELQDGSTLQNRPFLQAHYAHPFGVQFSHQRAFLRCPEGLSAGTYYFTFGATQGSNGYVVSGEVVCFTLTEDVPAGGRVAGCYGSWSTAKENWRIYSYSANGKTILETVTPTFVANGTDLGTMNLNSQNGNLNSIQEMSYGWNRWSKSALRQYLNSSAAAGEWWTAQDEWDIAPDQLTTKPGFLTGLSEEFLSAMKTVKVTTYTNTVNDGGEADITYDRVFLPSIEQIHITPQIDGEGEVHEYWKQRSGSETPLAWYQTYTNMITYSIENHTLAQFVRLRSANRGSAGYTWSVGSSGSVYGDSASNAYRFSPLVVI